MENKTGLYSVAASTVTSILIVILFYIFAIPKVGTSTQYTYTDVYAGMVYVFILSMIVSASIWPGVIEKRLRKNTGF
ncbi:MAG: hypothetical protein PHH85_06795 [Candidatus Methanoperedens sp.]|nr:hypothetical protein [Candidatus Methanoperedens sp.]